MADAQTIGEMIVKLEGDASGLEKTLKDSIGMIKSFAGVVGAALAAWKVYDVGKQAVMAFSEAEDVVLKLKGALQSNGRDVNTLMADYNKFANAIQTVTRVDDDAVLGLLQTAESMDLTGDAAKRAVKNAVALAAARGIDERSAIRMTVALEQGRVEMLGRYFPALRAIKDPTLKAAKAQELLGNAFTVAKESANGTAGQFDQFSNAMGNLQEDFGEILAEFVKPLVSELKAMTNQFREILPVIKPVAQMIGQTFLRAFKYAQDFFTDVFGFFWNFQENSDKLWEGFVFAVSRSIGNAVKVFGAFLTELTEWGKFVITVAEKIWQTDFVGIVAKTMDTIVEMFIQLGVEIANSFGRSLVTTIKQNTPTISSWMRSLGFGDRADILDNAMKVAGGFEGMGSGKKKDFGSYVKAGLEGDLDKQLKASGARLKSTYESLDSIISPDFNLSSPFSEMSEQTEDEADAIINDLKDVKKAVEENYPFMGQNTAIRRGSKEFYDLLRRGADALKKTKEEVKKDEMPAEAKNKGGLFQLQSVARTAVSGVANFGPTFGQQLEADQGITAADRVRRQGENVRGISNSIAGRVRAQGPTIQAANSERLASILETINGNIERLVDKDPVELETTNF